MLAFDFARRARLDAGVALDRSGMRAGENRADLLRRAIVRLLPSVSIKILRKCDPAKLAHRYMGEQRAGRN